MSWERRDSYTARIQSGLTTESIREGLFRGTFTFEDWVRREGSQEWQQLATVDEFAGNVTGSRRRRIRMAEEDDALDMTPMIDCTFLLLIFFMITASFHMQKGLDFPPDKTQTQSPNQASPQPVPGLAEFRESLLIEINESDQLTLKSSTDSNATSEVVEPSLIVDSLKRLARDTKKTNVMIVAHELASHEAVVRVIDSCGQAGLKEVSLGDAVSQSLPAGISTTIKRN